MSEEPRLEREAIETAYALKQFVQAIDPNGLSTRIHLTVSSAQYDALHATAKREDLTMPEVIRRQLQQRPRAKDHEDDQA